ncbi:hypothetical protein GJ629_09555 [Halapricum sp. CBA1109]|uniref:hypothetical protein n=1 Tax=Halapricum sp. CBA1109 TaxID=2668068 RepID=UPI0012FAAC23|nr:hypothetical protein [Halapricum sp. CBA1109]MUV90106.1 hypothetical protein [Halapricum sp. CBA1109]
MDRTSRRAVLAALGSAGLAGCSALEDDGPDSVTPYGVSLPETVSGGVSADIPNYGLAGPPPLGDRAVPPGSPDPPAIDRERVYAADRRRTPVDVAARESGLEMVVTVTEASSLVAPQRLRIDDAGSVTEQESLESLPTTNVGLHARTGSRTVVGGSVGYPEGWLYALEDRRVVYESDGDQLRAAAPLDGDVVAAGTVDSAAGVLARVGPTGTVRWRERVDGGTALKAVATAPNGSVFAYGIRADGGWLVAYDADGTERWQATVPAGEQSYVPLDLAVGPSGLYVLARGVESFGERPYFVLAAVTADGTVQWQRVLADDASYGETMFFGAVLDRGGPVVAGGPRLWRTGFEPDGGVRWSGDDTDDASVRRSVTGAGQFGGDAVLSGYYADADSERPDPWLAWF